MIRALVALSFAVACHAPPSAEHDAAASACATFGQSCTFSPGKLGTCVEVEETSGPAKLVCQSQH